MLRIFISSIMRWRSGETCLVMTVLLSTGLHESAILTGASVDGEKAQAGRRSIGAKVVSHGRYVAFQMAEVAILRNLFADILRPIAELRPPPVTSTA